MKKNSFNILLYYLKKQKKLVLLFLVVRLAMTTIDIYSPLLIKNLIDKTLPSKNIHLLFSYSIILVVLYIVRMFFAVNSQINGKFMGAKIKQNMRDDLVEKIFNQPSEFFKKRKSGELISRVISDLESVSILCHRGLEDFIFSVVTIFASVIIMFDFNVKLSIVTLLPLPITLIFVYNENLKMKKGYRKIRKNAGHLSATLHELLRTIPFLKDNYLEKYAKNSFYKQNSTLLQSEKKNMLSSSLLVSGVTFYSNITQLIVILAGGYLYMKNESTMGVILSFLLLVDRFRLRIMRMVGLVDIYQKGVSGVSRFVELINLSNRKDGDYSLNEQIHTIEFQNISFSYDNKSILQNFNLKFSRGDKIAIVGESGIGKSTTASLLKRALTPTDGKILINGIPLNSLTFESYLKHIGVVEQKDYILSDSILNNITIVNENYTQKELDFAIKNSYIYEVFNKFPTGKNTIIGEGGVHISSGQCQKVAIARLFLKNPDLILLDEATNALDIINETSILNNIKDVYKNKIIVAITHRLSILKDFNKIYVLHDGNIVESGTFEELLSLKNRFYRLYNGIR